MTQPLTGGDGREAEDYLSSLSDQVSELPACAFHVVVFCLLLEYLPAPAQRWTCCMQARRLLMGDGLLVIVTPDSHRWAGVDNKIIIIVIIVIVVVIIRVIIITTTIVMVMVIVVVVIMMIVIIIIMVMIIIIIVIIITIMALKGTVRDFVQSPHCAANCLRHALVSRAQSCANHVQHIERFSRATCRVPRKNSSAIKFDRV